MQSSQFLIAKRAAVIRLVSLFWQVRGLSVNCSPENMRMDSVKPKACGKGGVRRWPPLPRTSFAAFAVFLDRVWECLSFRGKPLLQKSFVDVVYSCVICACCIQVFPGRSV